VIVRTRPGLPPSPDMLRAMERLESQLRRAADDLALAIAAERAMAPEPWTPPDRYTSGYRGLERCGRLMEVLRQPCARLEGHGGQCRSRAAMESDRARRRRDADGTRRSTGPEAAA
jgi:hypothetical protein